MHKNFIFAVLLILAWPLPVLSAVSPGQLDGIMENMSVAPPSPANVDALLDRRAEIATKALGQSDPAWTDANPKWAVVYAKVRADLTSDNKAVGDYLQQAPADSKKIAAENMDPTDIKAITNFYNTDEGKRYQTFSKQADVIARDGMLALMDDSVHPPPQTPLSKEQIDHYTHMLMQSKSLQIHMAIMKMMTSTGAGDVMGFSLGFAIQTHPADVEKLYQQYEPDIDKFDAFNRSAAQQHFLHAQALATQQVIKKVKDIEAAQASIRQKHQEEWAALYQQQMANGK
jgi:hypothetical protein